MYEWQCVSSISGLFCKLKRFTCGSRIIPALQVVNENGSKRVIVTKELPGERWLQYLTAADCRVEISRHPDTILSNEIIKKLIGDKCDGVIGQLTEVRRRELGHMIPW